MKNSTPRLTACVIASAVGACVAVATQPNTNSQQPRTNQQPSTNQQLPPRTTSDRNDGRPTYDYSSRSFASADKLRGSTVENSDRKNIGTISDLIIDRGSGAVTYVVLDAGGILGIGSKSVAIPFSTFAWEPTRKLLTLETTVDKAKMWPEFEEKNWGGTSESLSSRLSRDYYRTPQNYYPSDASGEETHVRGTVVRTDRRALPGSATEEMVVVVRKSDGSEEEVVLGPSYYLSGDSNAIYRDAPIDVVTTRMDRDGRSVNVARSYNVNSRDTSLYDKSGKAHWWSWDSQSNKPIGYPFLLNSEIDGKDINARGQECGKVDDLIIETGTGRVVFISIDPDQNFLGIGDTKRLIPWGVAMVVTTDGVNLDATKSMITSAPETPSDFGSLSSDSRYQNVYQGFGISEPYYYDRNWDNRNWNNPSNTNAPRRDRDLRDARERQPK